MSKRLKNLMMEDLKRRLDGVQEAVLVNVIGIGSNETVELRKKLREKNIRLMVVKTSLARRATEGTPLAAAFEGAEGALAIMWGTDDMVSLAKEAMRLHKEEKELAAFQARGGVMDGERLTAEKVEAISKWPSRGEQLSILVGQILAPGANLLSQINAPGGLLLSQIKKKSEESEAEAAPAEPAEA